MNSRSLTDFMFAGMAVVPGVLVWMGELGLAIIAFVPLLIAACLFGWHEQFTDSGSQVAPGSVAGPTAKTPP